MAEEKKKPAAPKKEAKPEAAAAPAAPSPSSVPARTALASTTNVSQIQQQEARRITVTFENTPKVVSGIDAGIRSASCRELLEPRSTTTVRTGSDGAEGEAAGAAAWGQKIPLPKISSTFNGVVLG